MNRNLKKSSLVQEIRGERRDRKEKEEGEGEEEKKEKRPFLEKIRVREDITPAFLNRWLQAIITAAKLLPLCQELDTTIKVINGHA